MGKMVKAGWAEAAEGCGLAVNVTGIDPWPAFGFDYDDKLGPNSNRVLSTLFKQEMLSRGFLANVVFQVMFTHKEAHIMQYLCAIKDVFELLKKWCDEAEKQGKFTKEGELGANDCHSELKKHMKETELEYAGFQRLCK